MIIKKSIFFVLLPALVYFSCSDEPTSIGGNIPGLIPNPVNVLTLNSSDDSLSQSSSYFHPEGIKTSAANTLLLGKSDNINASVLIKFSSSLPDSIQEDILNNSINVNSAEMVLTQIYRFGDESASFDFTIHKITSSWGINFTEDSLNNGNLIYEAEDLSAGDPVVNDSITTVSISNQLVSQWLNIEADTSLPEGNGIYLKPADGINKILGYQAININLSNVPLVRVVIEKAGSYVDTLIFSSTLDVGVVQGNLPTASNENILVRSGYAINSKLFFDLSTLPENIIVNKADLILTLDTLETKVGNSYSRQVQAYYLFDSTNTDSISSSSIAISGSGNIFTGQITTYVRSWVDNRNNQGMILKTASPLNGAELFVIKGSNSPADVRPLLKLTYTKLN